MSTKEKTMATRADAIAKAREHLHSGAFITELNRRVGFKTQSQEPLPGDPMRAYLVEGLTPAFEEMGFTTRIVESPIGKGPYLLADYREDPSLLTVLSYGHGSRFSRHSPSMPPTTSPWP
jgi:hypothetical protein